MNRRLRLRPLRQPPTQEELQRSCARWAGQAFAFTVLFQRFAIPVPGLGDIALLLPIIVGWCIYGLLTGVLDIDRTRTGWWLTAAGATGIIIPLQQLFVVRPIVSATSWALIMVTWLPFIVRLRDRRRATYLMALRSFLKVTLVLSVAVIVFMASQLLGVPYTDFMAQIFPANWLLQGFVITYPITYGSPIYRGNAWIGLEPSVVSTQIAVGVVAALLLQSRLRVMIVLLAGMLCTVGGSGLAIVAVAIPVVLFSPMRWVLLRYALAIPAGVIFVFTTPWGLSMFQRVNETSSSTSSASLRGITPYVYLYPQWIGDPMTVLLGRGPGSSQKLADEQHIAGLLIPTPIKLFFDYGLLGGAFLAAMILFMYTGGHSRSMAITLLISQWALQPGSTTMVYVVLIALLVTWWAPRPTRVIESTPVASPNAPVSEAAARAHSQSLSRPRPRSAALR